MEKNKTVLDDKLHWYKDAIIYELHIKAFRDGNGDGIGDFQGLLEKLDYLEELGVTAIWLLPFYPSPLKDDGYDIADYYRINSSYGNITQFRQFLNEAHKRNLKVITELVINHTSDQHPWFQRARNAPKGSAERNYYVWTDDPNLYSGVRIIFQDFEANNWTWDSVAQQYYWHRFFYHQPDLNYDNPKVQEEVFRMLDYWCKMGVDGFRLDAVPYLFERDGTNCENLPETHAFLKKLRKHVDDYFPGTLLLAEANMWPEDSASYFGNGDECQMNYHFPVMPRMFMALRMEDRYPITDIYDQTPAIPDTCQWAIFLRNHDELTLEMVTDEERDYMYAVYAKDPKAKINLGIRHRLSPLMDNNRRKIELLNYLLFSLPGTPVIYYGDEIGMGDNFYLGDRDGVRTPMQWSPDRNAGFSNANPQKLYLPVILDPEYHYESVNVETQYQNLSSLLWYMKRVINMRKRYKAFSRGDMKFINMENPKVLAFTRTYEDETMLVLVNLSRFSQPAQLDLQAYKGFIPVEVFSKNEFPPIQEKNPYFFTLSPHAYYWFALQKAHSGVNESVTLPKVTIEIWKDLVHSDALEELQNNVLPDYLPKTKWFDEKRRSVYGITIKDFASVALPENSAFILLIDITYESGLPETYQLPVTLIKESFANKLNEQYPYAVICRLKVGDYEGFLCDALFTNEFREAIFIRMVTGHDIILRNSEIQFEGSKELKKYFKEHSEIQSKLISAEGEYSSISYWNNYFLKIYRRVERDINPDLEITRFLTEQAKFKNIPAYAGAIEWKYEYDSVVLGMMQELVEFHGDGWSYVLDRLNNFNERILSKPKESLPSPELIGKLINAPAYDQLTDDLKELLGTEVADRIRLLGQRTAEMHKALASTKDLKEFRPEEFSLHYQRSLFSGLQSLVRETFSNPVKKLKNLPDEIKQELEEVFSRREDLLRLLRRIYSKKLESVKIRIHGNYNLGQILFTGKDLVVRDFGGSPGTSYGVRRLKRSPLRDVADMIRSFYYAGHAGLQLNNHLRKEDIPKLTPYVRLWTHYISGFFFNAYRETLKDSRLIPGQKEDLDILLETYLLEKAIYSLNYEINNRPDWVIAPVRIIKSLLANNV